MRLFNKVAIIGTGLIGGSLALAIKKNRLAGEIVGVSRHKKSLALAKKRGAIKSGSQSLDIVKDADLIVLATPVNTILALAPKISRFVKKSCIVTDVGSTKEKIVSTLEKKFPNFIGSHPLAGSEKRSIANASADLFKNSLCLLTPTRRTKKRAMNRINLLWKRIGARTSRLSPEGHDKILAFISHLPHIVAFSLIESVPGNFLKFGSTGLKDTTRIAASDSELWAEIFLSNRKNILKTIGIFEKNIFSIKLALKREDRKSLGKILERARNKRENL